MRALRCVLASSILALSAVSASAQDVGVPVCDDFLKKYDQCLVARVPAAQKETMTKALSAVRDNWTKVAQTPEGKTQLQTVCKDTADKLRQQAAALNCTW
jgi:hypothetical protein